MAGAATDPCSQTLRNSGTKNKNKANDRSRRGLPKGVCKKRTWVGYSNSGRGGIMAISGFGVDGNEQQEKDEGLPEGD